MTFSVVRQLAPGKECAATSAAAGGRSALYPWPLLLLSVSGLPFRVLEHCVALFIALLLLCAHLACASVVRDSECATTMLGWKNEHMDFGFHSGRRKCDRQCTVCTDAMGGWGWWACLVQEEHSHIDLPQHVATARGSQIQAALCGSVCVSAS